MAYLDHEKYAFEKMRYEAYQNLKKHLSIKDESGKLNEYIFALDYMNHLENELKEKEELVQKYQKFFATLQSFLPEQRSIYDKIY